MRRVAAIVLAILGLAGAARAEERDFCPDRPGKGSPPCVLDQGRFQIEVSGVDATLDKSAGVSTRDIAYGGLELRLGLSSTVEGQLTWTPYERVRTKDHGVVSTVSGAGDLGAALRWSLKNPAGDGLSIAVQPFVVAPTGVSGIGDDAWQGGVIVPVSIPLAGDWSLSLSPELDARPNASGVGRHAGYALAGGVGRAVGPVNLGAELWVDRDEDPSGHVTQASFDLTAAWTPKALPGSLKDVQLDASAYIGLNRRTPDLELVVGLAHRF
jgi:hypothetical protein